MAGPKTKAVKVKQSDTPVSTPDASSKKQQKQTVVLEKMYSLPYHIFNSFTGFESNPQMLMRDLINYTATKCNTVKSIKSGGGVNQCYLSADESTLFVNPVMYEKFKTVLTENQDDIKKVSDMIQKLQDVLSTLDSNLKKISSDETLTHEFLSCMKNGDKPSSDIVKLVSTCVIPMTSKFLKRGNQWYMERPTPKEGETSDYSTEVEKTAIGNPDAKIKVTKHYNVVPSNKLFTVDSDTYYLRCYDKLDSLRARESEMKSELDDLRVKVHVSEIEPGVFEIRNDFFTVRMVFTDRRASKLSNKSTLYSEAILSTSFVKNLSNDKLFTRDRYFYKLTARGFMEKCVGMAEKLKLDKTQLTDVIRSTVSCMLNRYRSSPTQQLADDINYVRLVLAKRYGTELTSMLGDDICSKWAELCGIEDSDALANTTKIPVVAAKISTEENEITLDDDLVTKNRKGKKKEKTSDESTKLKRSSKKETTDQEPESVKPKRSSKKTTEETEQDAKPKRTPKKKSEDEQEQEPESVKPKRTLKKKTEEEEEEEQEQEPESVKPKRVNKKKTEEENEQPKSRRPLLKKAPVAQQQETEPEQQVRRPKRVIRLESNLA